MDSFRIRQKGRTKQGPKWVIEKRSKGFQKWESRTLLPLEHTWNKLCPGKNPSDMSENHKELLVRSSEKVVQDKLSEPDEESIKRTLQEVGIE